MDQLAYNNLIEIVNLGYPNICLNYADMKSLTSTPVGKKKFYPITGKDALYEGKQGFFNNGRTMVWSGIQGITLGHIKLAHQLIVAAEEKINFFNFTYTNLAQRGWSDLMSFQESGSPLRIYKQM